MELRKYRPGDCEEMARLFYETVHTVGARDYSPRELAAWADGQADLSVWNLSFLEHDTVVAEENDEIIGFGDMDDSGYLDRIYVHRDYQRKGIASAIVSQLEQNARSRGVLCFTTHASIGARLFFEKSGYTVLRKNTVTRRGVELINFVMKKNCVK